MLRLLHSLVVIIMLVPFTAIAQGDLEPGMGINGCTDAPVLCTLDSLNGYTGTMENSLPDSPPCPLTCPSTVCENNIWFSFIADATNMNITVDPYDCTPFAGQTTTGIQGEVFQISDCSSAGGFTSVSNCFSQQYNTADPPPFTLNLNGLVPGGIYTIMFDGFSNSICSFTISVDNPNGTSNPPNLTNLGGSNPVCPGATVQYCVDYDPGLPTVNDYMWTVEDVGVIISPSPYFNPTGTQVCVDVLVTDTGSGSISVTGENDCFSANEPVFNITSDDIIVDPITDTICLGSGIPITWEGQLIFGGGTFFQPLTSYLGCDSTLTLEVYPCSPETIIETVNVCSSELPYEWCGNDYSTSGTYNCTTTNYECGGCPVTNTLILFIYDNEALIASPDTLTCGPGATMILDGSTSVIELLNGYSEFLWTGPGIISDDTLDIITIDEPGTYTLAVTTVSYIDPDFVCTSTYTVEVVEDAAYPDPVNIDGLVEICGPGSLDYTIIPAVTGVAPTGYTWTATGGVLSVVGDVATVDWATSGEICLAAYNICDTSAYTCLNVTVIDLPVVTDILGSAIACETDDMGIYNVLDNGWTYTWTVSNGASFITDATTSQLTVDFTTATADTVDICVIGESECGFSPEYCETVSLTLIPATPTVSGDAIVCVGESTTYSIEDDPFVTGILTTVTDSLGTITLNPNTIEITVEWTAAGNDEVCFEVSNLCGSAVPVCFGVEVVELPTASLTDQTINFCPSGSDEATLDVTLSGQGPWDIEVLDQNGIPVDTYNFTASPGEITVTGEGAYSIGTITDMNGCSGTSTGVVTLTPYISPTATLAGSGGICEGSSDCVMLEVALDQAPGWTIEYTIDNVSQVPVSGIMTSPYMLQICQPGAIELTSVVDGNGCEGAASGIVNVENFEVVSVGDITPICDVNGANYQIEFTITGGTGVYTINSSLGITGTLVGNVFTSEPILSESFYSFEVFDSNNCNVFLVDGVHVCNCVNEVGTMGQDLIEVCDPSVASATYDPTLEFLPSGDIIEFVLHAGNGLSLVSPIAFNTSADFSFVSSSMNYGQTYYISAICGADDGSGVGSVDISDLCLKVAQGTPVVFYEIPDFTVSLNDTICLGESHNIEISFTAGQAPWSLVYTDDVSGTIDTLNGIQDNPYTLTVSPTQLTNYTFTEVFNTFNIAVCSQAKNETVEVEVFEVPSFSNVQTACNDTADGYTVSFEIVGGNPTTYEVLPAGTGSIIGDTMFVSNIIPDGNPYSFELTNGFCGSVIIEDINPIDCPCLSDVGVLVEASATTCGDGSIDLEYQAAGSEFLDGDDVLGYFLYEDQIDVAGSVIQTNAAAPSFSFLPSMTYGNTYYIAAAVGNDDGGIPDLGDLCLDITAGVPVVWYEIPTVTLSGSTDICDGESTDLTLEFTGPTPYTVEIFDGTTSEIITGINTSPYIHTVTPTANTDYTVFSGSNDNCDLTITGNADVVVNDAPIVVGFDTTINANNTFVTVTIDISGGSLPYVISDANGPIDTINTTQYISADITCGDGYYFVVDDFNNCDPVIVEAASTDCPCITNVGAIAPDVNQVCNDTVSFDPSGIVNQLDGNDLVQYILHNGDGAPLQYANAANQFVLDTLSYGQSYTISAIAGDADVNGNVDLTDPCFSIAGTEQVTFYEVPNAILSGGGDLCLGNSMDLNVEFTSGVGPWTVALLNDIDNTTTDYTLNTTIDIITLSPVVTTNYSLVSVVDSEGVCAGTVSGSANIQVNTTPVVSNVNTTINANNTFVTVTFDITGGSGDYIITFADGTTENFSGTQYISTDILCGDGYYFAVDDQFGCGPVIVEAASTDCPCITNVGAIAPDVNQVCNDTVSFDPSGIVNQLDGNDLVQYILHNGDGVPVQYANAANQFVLDTLSYGQSYTISAIAGDADVNGNVDLTDPCFSIAGTEQVAFYEVPNSILSGGGDLCLGNSMDLNIEFTSGVGPWTVALLNDSDNTTTDYTLNNPIDIITLSPIVTTNYSLVSVVDSEGVCIGTVSGSATIQVNTTPVVSNDYVIEDFDTEELVVEFEINGGDQVTYTVVDVNGVQLGTITANQFVSFPFACDQIAGGVNQTFYISDQYNCDVVELEVFLECGCQTSIGDFDTNNTNYCYGDLISFDPIATFVFDGNDVLNYILTDDVNNLNTPIAVSQTPEFIFNPNVMDCGVDYFVIGVVGDNLGGGIADLNDQCLAVSAPMTVQVYCEIDFGFVEETITICAGETAFVNTFANVSGLFDLTIIDPVNGSYEILGVEDGDLISFEPQATGIYQLTLAVELETGLMCTVDLNDQVEIIVVETGFSGTVADEPVFCEGTDETVLLADLIDGEDAGGAWTAAGAYIGFNPIQGTFNVLGQSAGVYEFTYTVLGQASCPDVTTDVTVTVNPNPVADAGANQTITCNDLILDVGGSQTSQGGVFNYTWLFNNTIIADQTASTANVDEAGTYTLIVENSLTGCEATSEVLVDNIVETLIPAITLDDPNCFGANNGSILFTGVDGGQGPYLYSVDGGQNFQSINVFDTLYADNYEIVVMDVNGCESQSINVNIEDPEQIFVELELFVAQDGDLNNKEFVEDGIVSYNDTIVIQAQLLNEGVNTNISWYPDDLNDCENCDELSLVATNTMYIEVTVGAAGCQDTDALSIFVEKERPVFVPSIFSPNGDIANDLLEISVGSFVQSITSFEIFDRWGTKVYEITNFLPAQSGSDYWDGTYKGQNCQSGVYVYYMEVEMIDGSKEILKGDIALTR